MTLTLFRAGAIITGQYRYLLWRTWNPDAAQVAFVMCNPSTADGSSDDPTIRRCMDFAQSWGFGSLAVGNLFAYRSPSPRDLLTVADPVGPDNDAHLVQIARQSACLIAAWGCAGRYRERDRAVMEKLSAHSPRMVCLGRNADGSPKHPLYIRKGTERQCFLSSLPML